ncbi:hypothetical protein M413DRAFT_295814 [Hebeloma cylindrosporum]|uniref:Uncharacterized protein n=1 Tax=Hebeloma cylindrosporum TaxID=76867 RepID=A0A0C3CP44_HEBCY|nr:hypothetical protein M413DRAFT_295814 [Hebeloma cylindrosporum h7]
MPFLGEVPITTFFSRVESTSTKRKATTRNKSSLNKKRKTDDSEATSTSPRVDDAKAKKPTCVPSNITREGKKSSTSQVVLEPNSGKKQGQFVSFPTPPACNAHAKAHETPSLGVCSKPLSNPINEVANQRRTFFLPTPKTMPRLQSYHTRQSHRHSVAPDSQDPVLEPVHSSIHCTPGGSPRDPFFMSSGSPQPATPKRRNPSRASNGLEKGTMLFAHFTPERTAVCSSQSQLLSPVHKSPQRPHTNLERLRRSNSSDDSIPSSQIQERELTISSGGSTSKSRQIALLTSSLTKFSDASKVPTRTLSDELFSVPIQSTILSDIFPDESLQESQPEPAFDASLGTAENFFGGSTTESETDNEREGTNPYSEDGSLPSQPESSPASLGIPSSSLPPIVQVFHDMSFGNNDESYPPDFPMSLRS